MGLSDLIITPLQGIKLYDRILLLKIFTLINFGIPLTLSLIVFSPSLNMFLLSEITCFTFAFIVKLSFVGANIRQNDFLTKNLSVKK